MRQSLKVYLLVFMVVSLLTHPVPASMARAASIQNVCANAGTPENAVVHFYLALSNKNYSGAFMCLDPGGHGGKSLAQFIQGYATTVSSRLLIADRQPNGSVSIDLHAVDRTAGGLMERTFLGTWTLSPSITLLRGVLHLVRSATVTSIPTTSVDDIFAFDKQQEVQELGNLDE